tara:strand:- start:1131 stop:1286 length:156 start_codon:yes stop_codon:yes gene_type:complete
MNLNKIYIKYLLAFSLLGLACRAVHLYGDFLTGIILAILGFSVLTNEIKNN